MNMTMSERVDKEVDLIFTETASITNSFKQLSSSSIFHHNSQMRWGQNNLQILNQFQLQIYILFHLFPSPKQFTLKSYSSINFLRMRIKFLAYETTNPNPVRWRILWQLHDIRGNISWKGETYLLETNYIGMAKWSMVYNLSCHILIYLSIKLK